MMVITSPRLSGFVLLAIPVIVIPLVAFGRWVRRLSRNAQDTLADASAYASELVGAIRTVQAYTSERLANARFGGAVEHAYEAARSSTRARAVLTAIIIFIVFASVVAILWVGAHDVLAGEMTPGPARPVRAVCGVRRGRPRPAQRGLGRSLGRLRRRRAAVRNPARQAADHGAAASGARCRRRRAAKSGSTMSASPIRRGRTCWRSTASRCRSGPARRSRSSAPRAPARARCSICCCASTIRRGRDLVRRRAIKSADPRRRARAHRAGAAGIRDVRRHGARQHPLRPARCQRRRGRARRRAGARHRIHPPAAAEASRPSSASAA